MFAKGNLAWAGRAAGFAVLVAALGGCAPLAITAAGIGGSTAVSHMLGGITYRTFTVPMPQVKSATMTALGRMQIKVNGSGKVSSGEVIKAHAGDRDIEIELESLSPNTTRMRAVAKNGLLYDSATATEIIIQTEKILGNA